MRRSVGCWPLARACQWTFTTNGKYVGAVGMHLHGTMDIDSDGLFRIVLG
ncbi:MAG: hypothetical protein ABI748_05495 [Dokdonella sp.]